MVASYPAAFEVNILFSLWLRSPHQWGPGDTAVALNSQDEDVAELSSLVLDCL